MVCLDIYSSSFDEAKNSFTVMMMPSAELMTERARAITLRIIPGLELYSERFLLKAMASPGIEQPYETKGRKSEKIKFPSYPTLG